MKFRRTMKRGVSFFATLAIVFTMLLNVGVLEPKAASSVITINGVSMEVDTGVIGSTAYYKNGDNTTTGLTGTNSDWNAKYENMGSWTRLTLKNLNLEVNGIAAIDSMPGIYKNGLTLVLEGDNVITDISDTNTEPILKTFTSNNKSLNIMGDGTLTINDAKTKATSTVVCQGLGIAGKAKLTLNVGGMGSQQGIIKPTGAVSIQDDAALEINVSEGGANCYGLYITDNAGSVTVEDNASLSVNMADGIYTQGTNYDLYAINIVNKVTINTTGKVDLNVGRGYNCRGIYANTFDMQKGELKINVAQGNNQSIGIETKNNGNISISNSSLIDIKIGQEDVTNASTTIIKTGINCPGVMQLSGQPKVSIDTGVSMVLGHGIDCSGGIVMSGNSSTVGPTIDINMPESLTAMGLKVGNGDVTMEGKSTINVDIGDTTSANSYAYGVFCGSGSNRLWNMTGDSELNIYSGSTTMITNAMDIKSRVLSLEDNAKISIECGESQISQGLLSTANVSIADNASIKSVAGDSTMLSQGIDVGSVTMTDNASVDATSGDVTLASTGTGYKNLAFRVRGDSSISGNASIKATVGSCNGNVCAIRNDEGTLTISGGTVEAISVADNGQAFSALPVITTPSDFQVKTGANSATATPQADTAKTTADTYTGNEYALIKAIITIDRVYIDGIAPLAHGATPDSAATTTTEGVKNNISVTWSPTGAIVGGTEYTGTITIAPKDGYAFADDVEVYYGSEKLTASVGNDGILKATYKQTAKKLGLISVEGPNGELVADNGTALEDIRLPGTVAMETEDGNKEQIGVTWDLNSANYDSTSKEEQTFTLRGRAVIPEYVDAGNVSLDVVLNVRVKEADAEEPTTTSTEAPTTATTSTEAPTTTSTEAPTTATTTNQAPAGSMTDTEAPTTATTAATTETPDNSDSNVKTGDSTPLGIMVMLMLVSGVGMYFVAKKKM